jgi:hypothetical protein
LRRRGAAGAGSRAKQKRPAGRRRSAEYAAELRRRGLLDKPVRLVPKIVDLREKRAKSASIKEYRRGRIWLVRSRSKPKMNRKVQLVGRKWTCNCPAFLKSKPAACYHIEAVAKWRTLTPKQRAEADRNGRPYEGARRRALPRIIFPNGKAHRTRIKQAQYAVPSRLPELALELCLLVMPYPNRQGGGARKIPRGVVCYALIMKVAMRNSTYPELNYVLGQEPHRSNLRQLGWKKDEPPSTNAICTAIADRSLIQEFEKMLFRTARVGRKIDDIVGVDMTAVSSGLVACWLDYRHGAENQGTRPTNVFLHVYTAAGMRTGLVSAAFLTPHGGKGTAEVDHFEDLVNVAIDVADRLETVVADKEYDDQKLFQYCDERRLRFFVPPKDGTDPENATVGREGKRATRELHDEHWLLFHGIYRLRNNIERVFSASDRVNGHFVRCRQRTSDWRQPDEPKARIVHMRRRPVRGGKAASAMDKRIARMRLRDIARMRVGVARQNEVRCKLLATNLRALVKMEFLHDDRVDFARDKGFVRIEEMRYDEVFADEE